MAGAAACMLMLAAHPASAQGTDCLISPPGVTLTCPNPTLPATQMFSVGIPAVTNPFSSFSAQWTLLNNTAGASIISASSCGFLPGGATCPVAIQVTQNGSVTVRADLVIHTVNGQTVNKNCEVTLTVVDTTAPTITCPPDVNVECGGSTAPSATGTATATDCSPVTVTFSDAVTGTTCAGQIISRTWTATDSSGNAATCVQTITTVDTTAPTVTCPGAVSVGCFAQVPPVNVGSVTASDSCGSVSVTFVSDVPSNGQSSCNNVITRTYRATDFCGNHADCTQMITVNDTTPPVITCPPDVSVACGTSTDPSVTGSATATDNCDPNPVIAHSDVQTGACSVTPGPTGATITRTWTATDACNNTSSCVQIITLSPPSPCTPSAIMNLGGGCGPQAPVLGLSMPIVGGSVSLHVGSSTTNAQIVLAAQFAPFGRSVSLATPCVIGIDVSNPGTVLLDQYSTDSTGQWTSRFALSRLPELANSTFRVQAAVISPGGPLLNVQLSDTLQGTIGNCPPCTASREDWVGVGTVGATYAANWLTLFPSGMDIGIFNPGNGTTAPNGFRWTGDLTGQNALIQLLANLPPPGTPTSIIVQDLVNPTTTLVGSPGAGSLARYTAVLQLNIVFSAAGLLGGTPVPQPGIGPLVYMNPGDSLDGFTVNQILARANQVLAGTAPVPAGYTLVTLTDLLEQLSLSFENCTPSAWATTHLFVTS